MSFALRTLGVMVVVAVLTHCSSDVPVADPDQLVILDRAYRMTRLEEFPLYSTAEGVNTAGHYVGTRSCGGTPCAYVRMDAITLVTPLGNSSLRAIDDAGRASGYGGSCQFNGIAHATGSFRWNTAGSELEWIVMPGSVDVPPLASYCSARNTTEVLGTGPAGDLVGKFLASDGVTRGFVIDNGAAREVAVPGAVLTEVHGSDSTGRLVGVSRTAEGARAGFMLTREGFQSIAVPAAVATEAHGIGSDGTLVGAFSDAEGHWHGFVMRRGAFCRFDVPDADGTWAHAINASGVIVGHYRRVEGDGFRTAGFVLTPR